MKLRYVGRCRRCGLRLAARTDAIYQRSTKTVWCVECPTTRSAEPPSAAASPLKAVVPSIAAVVHEDGVAGWSAGREYERRRAKDEGRLRRKWGKLGGIAVVLSAEKQSTKAWATGAGGEERLGALLDSCRSESLSVLHDRRIPGSKANIDHIAITPAGVWVIDAKRYQGRPELRVEGGILRPRVERLLVGRRDCTKLVDGVLKQVELVREIVGNTPVTGVLCFVDADWPVFGGAVRTRGVHAIRPKGLVKLLVQDEGTVDVPALRHMLARQFRPGRAQAP